MDQWILRDTERKEIKVSDGWFMLIGFYYFCWDVWIGGCRWNPLKELQQQTWDFGADAQDHGTAAMGADWSVIFAQKLPQNPSWIALLKEESKAQKLHGRCLSQIFMGLKIETQLLNENLRTPRARICDGNVGIREKGVKWSIKAISLLSFSWNHAILWWYTPELQKPFGLPKHVISDHVTSCRDFELNPIATSDVTIGSSPQRFVGLKSFTSWNWMPTFGMGWKPANKKRWLLDIEHHTNKISRTRRHMAWCWCKSEYF